MKKLYKVLWGTLAALSLVIVITTVTARAEETVNAAPATTWNKKVKGLKKKTVKKTHLTNASLYGDKTIKVKYLYGYKISWKKVKGAKGYIVQRYAPAQEKWINIKSTKKTSFTLTDITSATVKLRVKAYKKVNGTKIYGKNSKTLKFKAKHCTKLDNWGWQKKDFFDQFAAEELFIEQNKIRKEAGVPELKWNNLMYEIGVYRLNNSGFDAHDNMVTDIYEYAENQGLKNIPSGFVMAKLKYNENLRAGGATFEVIPAWMRSSGHYKTMINSEYINGAIAIKSVEGPLIAISTYCGLADVNDYWNSFK